MMPFIGVRSRGLFARNSLFPASIIVLSRAIDSRCPPPGRSECDPTALEVVRWSTTKIAPLNPGQHLVEAAISTPTVAAS
jgi:hypothetical protein